MLLYAPIYYLFSQRFRIMKQYCINDKKFFLDGGTSTYHRAQFNFLIKKKVF